MKKISAIALAFMLLMQGMFSFVHAEQLAKIPALLAHFQAHHDASHEAGGHLSLLDFLAQHYGDEQHHEDDDHSELPCHCDPACCPGVFFMVPAAKLPTFSSDDVLTNKIETPVASLHSRIFSDDLLRPPLA